MQRQSISGHGTRSRREARLPTLEQLLTSCSCSTVPNVCSQSAKNVTNGLTTSSQSRYHELLPTIVVQDLLTLLEYGDANI